MAKSMHATARDYRRQASSSDSQESGQAPHPKETASFLLAKNLLFWGSAALTCFLLYLAGQFLLG